jgi:hypothetical protein
MFLFNSLSVGTLTSWTMVSIVGNVNGTLNTVTLYINGNPVQNSLALVVPLLLQIDVFGSNGLFGGFNGALDELRVYNSSLIASRIISLLSLYQIFGLKFAYC